MGCVKKCVYKAHCMGICLLSLLMLISCSGLSSQMQIKPVNLVYDESLKSEKIWPDRDMKKQFRQYWGLRFSDGVTDRLFAMEAPYIQEMLDEKKYASYIKGSWRSELTDIRIKNVEARTEHLFFVECIVNANVVGSDEKLNVYIKDWWLNIKDNWYHVLEDKFFFPEIGSPDDVKIRYSGNDKG